MDEAEQKQPKDSPVSEAAASTSSTVEPKGVSPKPEPGQSDTSTVTATTTPPNPQEGSQKTIAATKSSGRMSTKKSPDLPSKPAGGDKKEAEGTSEEGEGSAKKPAVQSSGPAGSSKNTASACDKNLSGASSVPGVPPTDGAVGPGANNVMAKMMEMMAKGSASATPKNPQMAKGSMPDMMAMMSGGGMPDMMAMMSGGGGMPDMMAMMSAGGNMGDMKSMMTKMDGGMMASLFDHIIDQTINRSESESSGDDEDSITIEIPCKHCSRFFNSQMSLKTHILVNHEHEDSSVLNLQKLVIDKGKRSVKGHHGTRRKQSKDCEKSSAVEAASNDSHQRVGSALNKVTTSQEDLSAAESSRGVKRGRSERSGSEAAESSGASGLEEGTLLGIEGLLRLGTGAVPSSCVTSSPPESRKRSARLRSLRSSSGDTSSQVTTKKSKGGDEKTDSDSTQEGSPGGESSGVATKSGEGQPAPGDPKSQRTSKETSKHKQIKTESKQPSPSRHTPVTRGKRVLRKDVDVSGSERDIGTEAPVKETSHSSRSRKGRQSSSVPVGSSSSIPAASSSPQGSEAVSTSRRSLRSHKSH